MAAAMSAGSLVEALSHLSPQQQAQLLQGGLGGPEPRGGSQVLNSSTSSDASFPAQASLEDRQALLHYLTESSQAPQQASDATLSAAFQGLGLYDPQGLSGPGTASQQDVSSAGLASLADNLAGLAGAAPSGTPTGAAAPAPQMLSLQPSGNEQSAHGGELFASLSSPAGGAYGGHHASAAAHQHQHAPPVQQQQQQQLASAAPPASSLPSSITVNPQTDPMQAAGLINFTFGQPGSTFFVLHSQSPGGSTSVPTVNAGLKVALSARKINQQANSRCDIGFVPFLATDNTEALGLLVYRCSVPADVGGVKPQVLKIETNSNPLLAGLSLFNILQSSAQPTEVIFSSEAAKVALQALSITRINLTNHSQDVILLPQLIDWPASGSKSSTYYHVRLTPTNQVLPCFQRQFDQRRQYVASINDAPVLGLPYAGGPGLAKLPQQQQPGPQQQQQYHQGGAPSEHLLMGQAGSAGVAGAKYQQLAGPGMQQPGVPMMPGGMPMMVMQQPGSAAAMKQLQGLPGGGGPGASANAAMLSNAAAAAAVGAHRPRARKADYVIVTEDTAIKNAAGAVAKVLGRVSAQGQCCPVYTEKKTESFTTVISVAVKAIAVARGYVCNEGTGHEVGFQPYLRNADKHRDLMDLQQYLVEKKMLASLNKQGAAAIIKSIENLELNLDEEAMHDERCEMAFDVYKVPQLVEPQDVGNLPVKVTAHSRPNVVSNIISKLVTEREGAVLITAGGKAMHVAMTAVVWARARLKQKGIDILLLPKFVTVDTTSTLGWESVFLRFNIVRWLPSNAFSSDQVLSSSSVRSGSMSGAVSESGQGRFMMGSQMM